jgi:uncharacterized protein YqeY
MAELKDRLRSDLTVSMRGRDELRTATIRMVLTAVTNTEVAGAQAREISDDEVVGVLAKEAKKRRDAADAFRQGGRPDLAEREDAEAAVIAGYLPAPLTDDELDEAAGDRCRRARRRCPSRRRRQGSSRRRLIHGSSRLGLSPRTIR